MLPENEILTLYKQKLYYGQNIADIGYILPDGNFIDITKNNKNQPTGICRHGDELLKISELSSINDKNSLFYSDKISIKYGWIECNKKCKNHQLVRLSYIEPTASQYEALQRFIDYCLDRGFVRVSSMYNKNIYQVYVLFYTDSLESGYIENSHLTSIYIINKIKKYYKTGILDQEQTKYDTLSRTTIRAA